MTAATTHRAVKANVHPATLHPLSRRIMHWLNALAILLMVGSGWRIYDYYPALSIDFGFPYAYTLGGDLSLSEALHNEDGLANALAWHFGAMWLLVLRTSTSSPRGRRGRMSLKSPSGTGGTSTSSSSGFRSPPCRTSVPS